MREFRRYGVWFDVAMVPLWGAIAIGNVVQASFAPWSFVWLVGAVAFAFTARHAWRNSVVRVSPERIETGSRFRYPPPAADVTDLVAVRWENPRAICFSERLLGGSFVLDLGGLTKVQREEIRAFLREHVPAYRVRARPPNATASAAVLASPVLPLTVRWPDAEPEVLETWEEVETGLEFFDSDDPTEPVEVVDALGRPVRLVVDALDVTVCALKPNGQRTP
ncbi:MAG: hypothetical protein F9K16_12160 [Thermoanaerobaculia bacterium]|nr:MAG: hypothetical protein F9K16_12160 [Thermoanaerobaculia bacterium]